LPDITIPKQLEMLQNWNGELRLLQNFKLKRFSRKSLQHLVSCSKNNQEELVADGGIDVSMKVPTVQITESDSQISGGSDINETAECLEKREQEIRDDSMDVSNK
jgi:hypothetical protein